jgi:hypothetical protein
MIVTEEEAKTKVCQETIGNQAHPPGPCIGSACMAWRWRGWLIAGGDHEYTTAEQPKPGSLRDGVTSKHVGYCGKAGKP